MLEIVKLPFLIFYFFSAKWRDHIVSFANCQFLASIVKSYSGRFVEKAELETLLFEKQKRKCDFKQKLC